MSLAATTAAPPPAQQGSVARVRDPALDLLRAIALARVFVWHTFPAPWLTAIAAMPVMFFVAGTMLPEVRGAASYLQLLQRRGRRLLVPFWAYAAVVWGAAFVLPPPSSGSGALAVPGWSALAWVLPITDPSGHAFAGGWLASHLWYLRAYLWIVAATPALVWLARAGARAVVAFAAAGAVLAAAEPLGLPVIGAGTARVLVGDLVCYGLFAALGCMYARRTAAARPGPRWSISLAAAVGLAAAATAYGWVQGVPDEGVNGSYLLIVLTGLAWLAALQAAETPVRRLAARARVAATTRWISGRSLTVYVWHTAAIVLATTALSGSGAVTGALVLALAAAVTAVFVAAFGPLEDRARANRSAPARPGAVVPSPLSAARATAIAVAVAVCGLAVAEVRGGATATAGAHTARGRLAPSYREALRNDAFPVLTEANAPVDVLALRQDAPAPTSTTAATATAKAAAAPAAESAPPEAVTGAQALALQAALDTWRGIHPEIDTVTVALDVGDRVWLGESFRDPQHPHHHAGDGYPIKSVSKTFTAALVLQAVERGQLALDTEVPDVEGVEAPRHRVTVRQLLTHSTGLADYTEVDAYDPEAPLSVREAVNLGTRAPQRSWPGKVVHYANTNFLYLQLLLEQATGRSYEALVAELAARFGLPDTRVERSDQSGWAAGGAGGVRATLADLARWGRLLFTPGEVLRPETTALLTTLDEHNLGLGTWPICPCWADSAGVHRYTAIGHHVGSGGVYHYPATGVSASVRIEPQGDAAGGLAAELGSRLGEVLGAVGGGNPAQ